MRYDEEIVVAIPCYNEEKSVGKVIDDFRKETPSVEIVVFDNNSTDQTAAIAISKGVKVIREKRQGKGWVIRSIFEKINADIYVIVDGDDTYPVDEVHKLIDLIHSKKSDMAVGNRLRQGNKAAISPLHWFGNYMISSLFNVIFGSNCRDVLSGFRVFNREFVKNIPLSTRKFEIEVELTFQALEYGYIIKEIPISYRKRPKGSFSKLSSFRDGYRIILTMVMFLRDHKPHRLFSLVSFILIICSAFLFKHACCLSNFFNVFSALGIILSVGSLLIFFTGLILSAINARFAEISSIIKKNNNCFSKEK